MHLKMMSGKWRPFCLSLNVLTSLTLNLIHVYSRQTVSKQMPVDALVLWCDQECVLLKIKFDGLVQNISNPIANTLELLQPSTKPSINSPSATFLRGWLDPV